MRKATATVVYKKTLTEQGPIYQVYNITVNTNKNFITLVWYEQTGPAPYKYIHFTDLYKSVLNIAKNNGFYFDHYTQFGATWYNIQWINIDNPTKIYKYSVKE